VRTSFLLLALFPFLLHAQFLENPSLEGPVGMATIPPGWYACKDMSTPDTHGTGTFIYGINGAPSHGTNFVGLVTRGLIGAPNDGLTEAIGTSLKEPLRKDQCYKITLALSSADDMVHDDGWGSIYYYDQPVLLNIYGGNAQCSMEHELATSAAIAHAEWKDYSFNFTPTSDIISLVFEADYPGTDKTLGNILLDNIRIEPLSIDLGQDLKICAGQPVTLTLKDATNDDNIQWSNGVSGNSIVVNKEGAYFVKVIQEHCVLTDSVKVSFVPALVPPDHEVIALCEGEDSQIGYHVDGAFYRWNTGQTSEQIQVSKTGTYALTIDNGCDIVSKTFEVNVINTCCTVSAPNIFTPNDDNKNDYFQIFQGDRITSASLQIVNRWGSNIYEATDLNNYWDGNSRGVEVSTGIYFWTIVLNCAIDEEPVQKTFKGTITLQR
jgi:gliding motility-associated-like protein